MRPLLALLSCMIALPAVASPDRVSVLLGSHHANATLAFEQVNPGLFLTWENRGIFDLSLGAYRNSFGRPSVAVMAALPLWSSDIAQISVFAGAAVDPGNGHQFTVHAGDVVPIGGLQARVGRVFVQIIPSDGKTTSAILTGGLTFPLDSGG